METIKARKQLDGVNPGDYVPFCGVYPNPVPAEAEVFTIETGVIVLATGFKSYVPRRGEYGYRNFKEVITLTDLIQTLAETPAAGDRLIVNGRKIRSMAMIHCVGSRHIPGIHPEDESGNLNEYCSRTCCSATLNAATMVRQTYPGTSVYEFYRDIRTYGRGQEELTTMPPKTRWSFCDMKRKTHPRWLKTRIPTDIRCGSTSMTP
jgi:heterodisulfide reductase subunit A